MIRALYSAASGMSAQETNIDNIANNLANANTVGFKSRRAQFQDLMYQSLVQPGTASGQQTVVPTGLQLGLGTRAASNEIIFTQGAFTETDNPLDLVIQGNGFFQIQMPNGTLSYTRAGQFQLDKTGNVVTPQGYSLSPQITVPAAAQQITIAGDGTVRGNNLYAPTDASGDPTVGAPGGAEGLGSLLQGYTEQSNVSIVNEFINLIQAQRGYESNSKVVQAADQMYQQVNGLIR
jgi:flagellar basal-body rod protein FlgG